MALRHIALQPEMSPIWLRGFYGSRFQYLLGAAHDHFAQYVFNGISQRFPSDAEAASRRELAHDRGVQLFETEPVPSQRERLRKWRSAARAAGTDAGVLNEVRPWWLPEVPRMRLVAGNSEVAHWTTLNADGSLEFHRRDADSGGSNWDWNSAYPHHDEPVKTFRWWLIVYAPPSVNAAPLVAPPSDTISVGSSLSVQQALDVQGIAAARRAASSSIWGWILAFDPASFDPMGGPGPGYPDGTWHESYNSDGTFKRVSTARYHVEKYWTPTSE
jgi:hypothetical protein